MRMFNILGFRRLLQGEPMPDKDDPKYRERYEREVAAGARFARMTGLAWLGRHYVAWAENNKKLFFAIVLSLMMLFVVGNLYRFATHFNGNYGLRGNAIAQQDSALHQRFLNNR